MKSIRRKRDVRLSQAFGVNNRSNGTPEDARASLLIHEAPRPVLRQSNTFIQVYWVVSLMRQAISIEIYNHGKNPRAWPWNVIIEGYVASVRSLGSMQATEWGLTKRSQTIRMDLVDGQRLHSSIWSISPVYHQKSSGSSWAISMEMISLCFGDAP